MDRSRGVGVSYNESRSGVANSERREFRLHANGMVPRTGSDHSSCMRPAAKSMLSPSGTARTTYVLFSSGKGEEPDEAWLRVAFRPNAVRTERLGTSCTPTTNLPSPDASWTKEFSSVKVGLLNQPRIGMPRDVACKIRLVAAASKGVARAPCGK